MPLPHTRTGRGERALVLLHGWFAAAAAWGAAAGAIDTCARDVIVPDLRGAGRARSWPGPYDERSAVADLRRLLDVERIDRAVVAGHSMSAKIALAFAAEYPERVESVVALAPVPPGGLAFDERAWGLYRAALDDREALASLIGVLSGRRYPRAWARDEASVAREAMTREAAAGYLEAFVGNDLSARVRGLETPVLALCGAADPALTPAFVAESLRRSCRSVTVAALPGCTHYPLRESPLLTAAAINAWCAGESLPDDVPVCGVSAGSGDRSRSSAAR